jgi:hypothetical protein
MSVMLTMAVVVEVAVAVAVTQRTTRLHDRSMATALVLM